MNRSQLEHIIRAASAIHDLLLAKYAANREKDRAFNRAVITHGFASQPTLHELLATMPLGAEAKNKIQSRIDSDFSSDE